MLCNLVTFKYGSWVTEKNEIKIAPVSILKRSILGISFWRFFRGMSEKNLVYSLRFQSCLSRKVGKGTLTSDKAPPFFFSIAHALLLQLWLPPDADVVALIFFFCICISKVFRQIQISASTSPILANSQNNMKIQLFSNSLLLHFAKRAEENDPNIHCFLVARCCIFLVSTRKKTRPE